MPDAAPIWISPDTSAGPMFEGSGTGRKVTSSPCFSKMPLSFAT